MTLFTPIKPPKRPRSGLYSVGHACYRNQFDGLLDRLLVYNRFIAQRMSALGDVCNVDMIDGEDGLRRAAEQLNAANVDLIFCHAATYAMSALHLDIGRHCRRPVIVLNLQLTAAMRDERATTGVSVEAIVRKGSVTLLNLTQTGDGMLRLIVNQGEAIVALLLNIGNTMMHVKFAQGLGQVMNEWFALAAPHHAAMSFGHNTAGLSRVATLMEIPFDTVAM